MTTQVIPARADAGFTLIEALVAMAVLALGTVSLLTATEGHSARISAITDRIAARWAAEERLSQLRLGIVADSGAVEMLGRRWSVTEALTETSDPDLAAVAVRAAPEAAPQSPLVILNGYLDKAGRG